MVKNLLVLVLFLSIAGVSLAAIYKWVDKEGNVHYSDSPASGRNTEKIHVMPPPPKVERNKSKQRLQKLLEEQRQTQQSRERDADAKKLADLLLEFGGHWVMGKNLEQQCHEKYNLSCDAILKWKKKEFKKFKDLVLEFGGTWAMGIGIDQEQQCHEKYNLSCNALLNWKKQALKKCKDEHGSDQDCENDAYLLKFKPLTIEEQRQRAIQLRSRQRRLYNR